LAATLADAYPSIDVLANNAGGYFAERAETADGLELTFQVNHLAPFPGPPTPLPNSTTSCSPRNCIADSIPKASLTAAFHPGIVATNFTSDASDT